MTESIDRFSLTEGIGLGFIGHAALKAVAGRAREAPRRLYSISALLLLFAARPHLVR